MKRMALGARLVLALALILPALNGPVAAQGAPPLGEL